MPSCGPPPPGGPHEENPKKTRGRAKSRKTLERDLHCFLQFYVSKADELLTNFQAQQAAATHMSRLTWAETASFGQPASFT